MTNRFIFLMAVLGFFCLLDAQEILPFPLNRDLAQLSIRALATDSEGFLWIGTHDGLNRYDGQSIQKFTRISGDPNSLASDNILDLLLDSHGHLWVLTGFALNRYDSRRQQFEK